METVQLVLSSFRNFYRNQLKIEECYLYQK